MSKNKPIRHRTINIYTPITLTVAKKSKDFRLLLKVLEPAKYQLFNNSVFGPLNPKECFIQIGVADFSDFFRRLCYYADINTVGEEIEGLKLYRVLAAGYLSDLIFHLYGYITWE